MIGELGHFFLICALFFSLYGIIFCQLGLLRDNSNWQKCIKSSSAMIMVLLNGAFISLILSHVFSDFSLMNVWQNSHLSQPLIYKITGSWGNHEGSLLLWLALLAIINYLLAFHTTNLPKRLHLQTLVIQHLILLGFLLFVLLTSNPFLRLSSIPYDGLGLNPILQDPALALHPPLLYSGYILTTVPFSIVLAFLLTAGGTASGMVGKHSNIGFFIKRWVSAAWIFLTLGISLGSWWAYYELGWGGFWAWDPVENASLMPWLITTALLHSAIVTQRTRNLTIWTILLSILAYSLSLVSLFLVRSGVLISVHAFSIDPQRGLFIIGLLVFYIASAMLIFSLRAPRFFRNPAPASFFSREGLILVNNLLLITLLSIIFIGTLYPLFLESLSGYKISVGAPFFELSFVPFSIFLLLFAPLAPLLGWRRAEFLTSIKKIFPAIILTIAVLVILLLWNFTTSIKILFGISLGVWLLSGSAVYFFQRLKLHFSPLSFSTARLSQLCAPIAHFGLGIVVIGIVCASLLPKEKTINLAIGASVDFIGYNVKLVSVDAIRGENYIEQRAVFALTSLSQGDIFSLNSAKRIYSKPSSITTEVGIFSRMGSNYYITMHDKVSASSYNFKLYYHPLVNWIWYGTVIMAVGGFLSFLGRKPSKVTEI